MVVAVFTITAERNYFLYPFQGLIPVRIARVFLIFQLVVSARGIIAGEIDRLYNAQAKTAEKRKHVEDAARKA